MSDADIDKSKSWRVYEITVDATEDNIERVYWEAVFISHMGMFTLEHGHQVCVLRGTYDTEEAAHAAVRTFEEANRSDA